MKKKFTIEWIKHKSVTGGAAYEIYLERILKKNFNFEILETDTEKSEKYKNKIIFKLSRLKHRIIYLLKVLKTNPQKDIIIRDFFYTTRLLFHRTTEKNIVLIHHIDSNALTHGWFYRLLEPLFYLGLRKADAIVTVSNYWKKYFEERGYKNVYAIYNCFNVNEFKVSDHEVELFKKKYGIEKKPIIYIGNCQKIKGVFESYNILKDLDVYLVTSGKRSLDIPVINLNLSYKEYLVLLKASSVIVLMSHLNEGWCRTAHEAMLLKKPVIGSGKGGMGELLKNGRQIICKDFKNLIECVQLVLNSKKKVYDMQKNGSKYAKQFTEQRFQREWLSLIESVKDEKI